MSTNGPLTVDDVVDEFRRIIAQVPKYGQWPSEADLETLLARFPAGERPTMADAFAAEIEDPPAAAMMFAWLAVDRLRQMTVLASHGYNHWTDREFAFFFLKMAVVSAAG
jgi:hypothetical protein